MHFMKPYSLPVAATLISHPSIGSPVFLTYPLYPLLLPITFPNKLLANKTRSVSAFWTTQVMTESKLSKPAEWKIENGKQKFCEDIWSNNDRSQSCYQPLISRPMSHGYGGNRTKYGFLVQSILYSMSLHQSFWMWSPNWHNWIFATDGNCKARKELIIILCMLLSRTFHDIPPPRFWSWGL